MSIISFKLIIRYTKSSPTDFLKQRGFYTYNWLFSHDSIKFPVINPYINIRGELILITIYTDGATNSISKQSGAGIYIKAGEKKLEFSLPLNYMSNHEAEFYAIIEALKICKETFPNEILSFRTDSKVAAEVIDEGKTKNKHFQPLLEIIQTMSADVPFLFIKWIPEKENSKADQLAKKAIQHSK